MRTYELVVVVKSALTEEKRKKLLEIVKSWLKEAKITKENVWGQKALAYQIRHEKSGYYYQLLLEAEAGMPTDFEKRLIASEDVLRHLLIRTK